MVMLLYQKDLEHKIYFYMSTVLVKIKFTSLRIMKMLVEKHFAAQAFSINLFYFFKYNTRYTRALIWTTKSRNVV